MPRRKQHVQEMEKYEVRVPSSMTRVTLGPMFSDWEAQRSAAGFGPSSQQQWIKHLLEVHSLACNGQGCARMYEGVQAQGTQMNKSRGRPKGSTSPRNPGSPRSRGRPRKGSPHRNTSAYVDSVKMQQEDDEEEEEEVKKESTSDSDSTSGSTNGETGGKEHCSDDKQQAVSSSDSAENDTQGGNQEVTGLEDIGEENNAVSQDQEPDQGENHESEQTITFEQVDDSQLVEKTTLDTSATQLEQQSTPPSSPSTTTSTNKSTLPPTAEYREVRLRRGNGYYIKEYIYIKNRDCNGKIFLRCQFRASCRARAVVLIDTGRVIVTQGRHTHPPPHPQMIRFGPHIKDISATWANRVGKKESAQAKSNMDHHQRKQIILAKHTKKSHKESPAVVTQAITQHTIQQSIPIASAAASPVVSIPQSPVVPVAAYKFAPQFTTAQGSAITAANNIINVQAQPIDNGGVTAAKVNSGMPLIVKSWSLLKGNQPNNIVTQPLNVLQQAKTCLLLQSNPPNSNSVGLINVASQPQVSIAYNFNPGGIISQPITTFTQSPLMQRVVLSQNIDQFDQNATNLSLKDNQFVLDQGITSDAFNSATVTTIQPQPTSPLPVQLVAAAPVMPENGGQFEQLEQQQQLTTLAENGATLDLRVVSKQPEVMEKTGKKRANIFSITEKLMKQKQQRLGGEDQ